jgi:hypothetical protein
MQQRFTRERLWKNKKSYLYKPKTMIYVLLLHPQKTTPKIGQNPGSIAKTYFYYSPNQFIMKITL